MLTYIKKIPIPSEPEKLIDLGVKVYARHCVMGNKSPLLALQTSSWEENGDEVNNALRLCELIKTEFNPSLQYFQKRDELLAKIKASLEASQNLLSDIYHDNQRELGFWGFDVE
jgi:exonuclease VII small subunit